MMTARYASRLGRLVPYIFTVLLGIMAFDWLRNHHVHISAVSDSDKKQPSLGQLSVIDKPRSVVDPVKDPYSLLIPKIIHQSWKTNQTPSRYTKWRKSWEVHHPSWKQVLWTDDDNLELVKRFAPWFLHVYNRLPHNINRADAARYLYMYVYGGFYADLDMECLKSHERLRGAGVLLGHMSDDFSFEYNTPNAWMGSVPRHPFWIFILEKINQTALTSRTRTNVETLTGAVLVQKCYYDYKAMERTLHLRRTVHALEPGQIYPYDWRHPNGNNRVCNIRGPAFDPEKCKKLVNPTNNAYTITYWANEWSDEIDVNRSKGGKQRP